jgi:DNA (cytosine-5)-methyltransferase 1
MTLGLQKAAFEPVAIVEVDPEACETLRRNSGVGRPHPPDLPLHETDVRDFDFATIRADIDLLAAGAPCQPFSWAGSGQGQHDDRNMFPEVIRAAAALAPKVVLIENVKGLLRPSFTEYFDYFCLKLAYPEVRKTKAESWQSHRVRLHSLQERGATLGLTYSVFQSVLNAADYGVPQWRERIFIVAIRSDIAVKWAPPSATHSLEGLLWSQWRSGDYWREHGLPIRRRASALSPRYRSALSDLTEREPKNPTRWLTVRDGLQGLPQLRQGQRTETPPNHFLNPGARAYTRHTGSPLDEPAKTLKAGAHGVPGGENTLALGGGRVRYFSVRECARIQTFPDDYVFPATWSRAMRQVGNAVPVILAEAVGKQVATLLKAHAFSERDGSALAPVSAAAG